MADIRPDSLDQQDPAEDTALDEQVRIAYQELRKLAAFHFSKESPGHTLQPTAVVHEAFIRLADQRSGVGQSRAQFLGIASRMIKRILIDHARSKKTAKRGGKLMQIEFDDGLILSDEYPGDFLAVTDALERLRTLSARQAQIVELRFFGGLTMTEMADVTGLSERTMERSWATARAWLTRELRGEHSD